MRTYLILKERAARWNADQEIQALVAATSAGQSAVGKYAKAGADKLLAQSFDRTAIASKGLSYEKLDQLTMEVITGS